MKNFTFVSEYNTIVITARNEKEAKKQLKQEVKTPTEWDIDEYLTEDLLGYPE